MLQNAAEKIQSHSPSLCNALHQYAEELRVDALPEQSPGGDEQGPSTSSRPAPLQFRTFVPRTFVPPSLRVQKDVVDEPRAPAQVLDAEALVVAVHHLL